MPVPKGVTYTLKDNHLAVKVRLPGHASHQSIRLSWMRRDSVVVTSPWPRRARGADDVTSIRFRVLVDPFADKSPFPPLLPGPQG